MTAIEQGCRAVMNIISNAIDYSPERAELTIAFEEKHGMNQVYNLTKLTILV